MADYTFGTLIVSDEIVAALREEFGEEQFNVPLARTAEGPPTHWMGSGPHDNDKLESILNVAVDREIYFGQDWQDATQKAGLVLVMVGTSQE